jgi:hypothetical protein
MHCWQRLWAGAISGWMPSGTVAFNEALQMAIRAVNLDKAWRSDTAFGVGAMVCAATTKLSQPVDVVAAGDVAISQVSGRQRSRADTRRLPYQIAPCA